MWTQFWKTPKENDILIIESEQTVAISLFLKLFPGSVYLPEHDEMSTQIGAFCYRSYIYTRNDLSLLTATERHANGKEYDYLNTLFEYKQKQNKLPKLYRYRSLKDYLNLPDVKIYYKADVDRMLGIIT